MEQCQLWIEKNRDLCGLGGICVYSCGEGRVIAGQFQEGAMHITFGFHLDGPSYPSLPGGKDAVVGELRCGPQGLLKLIETRLGLTGVWAPYTYRVEAYRRRLMVGDDERRFYHFSLQANSLAVAKTLLFWRDALLLCGWDFHSGLAPARLLDLAAVEGLPSGQIPNVPWGVAERMRAVLEALPRPLGIAKISLIDKSCHLMPPWERLFQKLVQSGVSIVEPAEPRLTALGDLGALQSALRCGGSAEAAGDGSLVIFRPNSDTQAAEMMASWLSSDGAPKPVLIIPPGDRTLSRVLTERGAPELGITSRSASRPILQILPILIELLWDPLNPFRLIEFLSLPETPFPTWVARWLAEVVAVAPGIGGAKWGKKVAEIESALAERLSSERRGATKLKELISFWLEMPRYRQCSGVPREAVVCLAKKIVNWAYTRCSDRERASEMKTLADHAKQLFTIVETMPEDLITQPHMLQLIRMIQKEVPAIGNIAEAGHLPWVESPDAVTDKAKDVIWWGFTNSNTPSLRRSPWTKSEIDFLAQKSVLLPEAGDESARLASGLTKPVFNAQDRLILVIPRFEQGTEACPHPLYARIKAVFRNSLPKIELSANDWLSGCRVLPALPTSALPSRALPVPQRFWRIQGLQLSPREVESYSSLNDLFYNPFKWVLKYKAHIKDGPLQGVSNIKTLMGNLAHRFFQEVFLPGVDFGEWNQKKMDRVADATLAPLMTQEGALLLLPGFEAERVFFVTKVKTAAWSMVCHIRDNGWRVVGTELTADGMLGSQQISGRIDLLLERDNDSALVDLKWSGSQYRREELAGNKALQLALYAHMLAHGGISPHVAFFIISERTLIATDRRGFLNACVVTPPEGGSLVSLVKQMELTWHWRWSQLGTGMIEVPVDGTLPDPEYPVCIGALVAPEDTCNPGEFLVLAGWKEENHA